MDGRTTRSSALSRSLATAAGLALLLTVLGGGVAADAEVGVDPPSALTTERVSVATGGTQATDDSFYPSVSTDGRFVAFISDADDLVSGDTNGKTDVFVRDRQTGTTERVSVATDGSEVNGWSYDVSISADGRHVAFTSDADDLVVDDTNLALDVFVHDRQTGTTERVSVATDGAEGDIASSQPSISADGRYVAFESEAEGLVDDDTNEYGDVFVRDRQASTTERVSVATDGTEADYYSDGPSISADGRYVAFHSAAENLVGDDANLDDDVFVHDRQTNTTERVSVATDGTEANGGSYDVSISADGRFVAFRSDAKTLVDDDTNFMTDVFVRDRQAGTTERVSVATGGAEGDFHSGGPSISADGRHVLFKSWATDLVAGDTNDQPDLFVHDRQGGSTERVTVAPDTSPINEYPDSLAISGDGGFVAFDSSATYHIAGDTNGAWDVFVVDRNSAAPTATGMLRVTTTPSVPGQIVVDGVARDSWGLNWAEFPVGEHEVCFGPVPGFTQPPCEVVEVLEDQTTTVDGAYSQRGTLRVLTSPAVPSTITIDGAPANDFGVWTDLEPGSYQVCFGAVADHATPACQTANVTAGATETITGVFAASPGAPGPSGHGYLRATTDPSVASRITVDGQVADTWGLTWLKLTPGTYEVCFEGVLYATAPACEQAVITAGNTTLVEGGFVVHGFLKVNTSPAVGATITIDGNPANAWGVWTSLEPGTYEVCYGPDPGGLDAPACEDAVVSGATTTELTGTYT